MREPRKEMLDMTDERKERLATAGSHVMALLERELRGPIEAHIVLKLCLQ
jgi:hypothetical protein